jgi:hypothetical protein
MSNGGGDSQAIAAVPPIDYSAAHELADEVRAFAIIESGENPYKVGDDGCAYGLLQMHAATFKRYYGSLMRFAPNVADSWSTAQIKACAAYLASHGWRGASQEQRDVIVQGWNLGERGVFVEGRRNPEYLARWLEAYETVKAPYS